MSTTQGFFHATHKKALLLFILPALFVLFAASASAAIDDITLEDPEDDAWLNIDEPSFNFTATSTTETEFFCELLIDVGEGFEGYGNNTEVANDTSTSITANQTLPQGTGYSWEITCNDEDDPLTSVSRTLNIDLTDPVVTITSPADYALFNIEDITLNFTVTDNLADMINWLYFKR